MIARLWRGRVLRARAAEYRSYQREVGPPGYRAVAGNRGVLMLGRPLVGHYEVAMFTLWDSWSAIRGFAGARVDRARYYDRDFEFLIDPPETVQHFEVVAAGGLRPGASVARLWRGSTEVGSVREALRLEAEAGGGGYLAAAGNRGFFLLGRHLPPHRFELARLSLWDSLESIRRFAGSPPERASNRESRRRGHDVLVEAPDRTELFEVLEAVDPVGEAVPSKEASEVTA